jgi:hypothetical protein
MGLALFRLGSLHDQKLIWTSVMMTGPEHFFDADTKVLTSGNLLTLSCRRDPGEESTLVVSIRVSIQIEAADIKAMRKSTGDLVWDFIVLCNDRKAVKKIREYEELTNHDLDERVITAICEYQLLLPLEKFMATGFEGCDV